MAPSFDSRESTASSFFSIVVARALLDGKVEGRIPLTLRHNNPMHRNSIDYMDGQQTHAGRLQRWPEELCRISFLSGDGTENFNRMGRNRVHFAFLDRAHHEEDVLREFSYLAVRQEEHYVVMFDDVTPGHFDGIVTDLEHIEADGRYSVVRLSASTRRAYAVARRL